MHVTDLLDLKCSLIMHEFWKTIQKISHKMSCLDIYGIYQLIGPHWEKTLLYIFLFFNMWYTNISSNLHRVIRLQKRAARTILDAHRTANSVQLFNCLNWIPFYEEAFIKRFIIAWSQHCNTNEMTRCLVVRNCLIMRHSNPIISFLIVCHMDVECCLDRAQFQVTFHFLHVLYRLHAWRLIFKDWFSGVKGVIII
jgi:hypothetical protein